MDIFNSIGLVAISVNQNAISSWSSILGRTIYSVLSSPVLTSNDVGTHVEPSTFHEVTYKEMLNATRVR